MTSFRGNGSTTRKTKLESLPTDIMLNIVGMLTGNEQIMAALVCKTLAAVVEASTVRKIGNITLYRLTNKDPASSFNQKTEPERWHDCGFVPGMAMTNVQNYMYWSYAHMQVMEQWKALKESVGKWLGPTYKFCEDCRKYRLIEKKFWTAFAEYENPGITKKVAKKEPRKRGKKAAKDAGSAEKIDAIVVKWYKTPDPSWMPQMCPAHELLKERNGERVLKKVEYEA